MPLVVDNQTDEEIETSILALKPKLKRSKAVPEDVRDAVPEPSPLPKPKKERTPAQLAALEKGRMRAKEKADLRKKAASAPNENLPPVEENSVQSPAIDIPKAPRAYRRPSPEDNSFGSNGWQAFAEYMVKEKDLSRQKASVADRQIDTTKVPVPKTVKLVPQQKETPTLKKIPRFS